jgi:hypothetical protein
MLDGDRADISPIIQVEHRVLIKITSFRDRRIAQLDPLVADGSPVRTRSNELELAGDAHGRQGN